MRGGDVTETPDGDPTTVNPDRVVAFEDGDTGSPEERGGGPGGSPSGPGGQQGGPDVAAVAAELGTTEEALV